MQHHTGDVVVIGSGFAGSLAAAILQRSGRSSILIDRARHPRFAIGESSTPTASLILRCLADRYAIDWLAPLAKYGSWKAAYPELDCGRKRGFSYFAHRPGEPVEVTPAHERELLVAASANDDVSDTQWLRSEVDAFFFKHALNDGVTGFEDARIESITRQERGWRIALQDDSGLRTIDCRFVIDASGAGAVLSRHFGIPDQAGTLKTRSRALFGHFSGLPRWSDILTAQSQPAARSACNDFPFPPDDAALHHLLHDGWSWWLRFDSDVTSVGLVLLDDRPTLDDSVAAEWDLIFSRYPELDAALRQATLIAPAGGLVRTGRLQRCAAQLAGDDWAMLPHTAGFIDPLHSSGIAHSLSGVERLCNLLLADAGPEEQAQQLAAYEQAVRQELRLIDDLVSGCQTALRARCFRRFVAFSKCYFAAATRWERRRLSGSEFGVGALFLADDPDFCATVAFLQNAVATTEPAEFETLCQDRLAAFDLVGLFDEPLPNMFWATALPE